MDHDVALLLVAGTAVFVGAVVQGGVGFGLGLVAPADHAARPDGHARRGPGRQHDDAAFTLAREWRKAEWRGAGFALLGRLPGSERRRLRRAPDSRAAGERFGGRRGSPGVAYVSRSPAEPGRRIAARC